MKVLVTGVGGQLGHDVMNELAARGYEGIGTDLAPEYSGIQDGTAVTSMPYISMDITNRAQVLSEVEKLRPDVIVHCAAWTAVDLAEDEDKIAKVHAVNVDGTRNMADSASMCGARIVYLSTDYVFDGEGERPWQPDDRNYAPLNVYGQTKLDGEKAVQSALAALLSSGNAFAVRTEHRTGFGFADLAMAPRIITFPNILYGALIEVKYIKKSEKVVEEAKASLLAEARSQLERYAEDHNLAETWKLKPSGTVTLIRLALVFHGEELLFAEEI